MKVAINAQLTPHAGTGGIETFLAALVHALGQLDDGPEEYILVCRRQEPDWLKPFLGPNQRIVTPPPPPVADKSLTSSIKHLLMPAGRALSAALASPRPSWPEVPLSDGFYEGLGCDVVHFPFQEFTLCALPSVYNPHDFQHRHYPQFFTPSELAWRETIYGAGCRLSTTVVVGSRWVSDDVTRQYQVSPEKIQVIPWAPATGVGRVPTSDDLAAVQARFGVSAPFALYPAVTWEHKNHIPLLESLASLRSQGLVVRLVCTGNRHPPFWPKIAERLRELALEDQVKFLGHVPLADLRALYRLAQFVVVPTLFEAASGPVFEAWQDGVPVACSTVTSLPEQAGEAALLFDPTSVPAIAEAVRRMATEDNLRSELVRKGECRLRDFNWERTAKAYRAVYRRTARRTLSEEDLHLLSWDWMRSPRQASGGLSCKRH
jgi:glycosyltransferase involved in cell wall biosynthesis